MKTKTLNENAIGRTLQVIYIGFYIIFSIAILLTAWDSYNTYSSVSRENSNLEKIKQKGDFPALVSAWEKSGQDIYDLQIELEKRHGLDLPYLLQEEDPFSNLKIYAIVIGIVFVVVELISIAALYITGFRANTLLITFIRSQLNQ